VGINQIRRCVGCLLAAVVLLSPVTLAAQSALAPAKLPAAVPNLAATMAQYRRALAFAVRRGSLLSLSCLLIDFGLADTLKW
jgi:hypothetical protein